MCYEVGCVHRTGGGQGLQQFARRVGFEQALVRESVAETTLDTHTQFNPRQTVNRQIPFQ